MLRQGRLTPGQQRAFERYWLTLGVSLRNNQTLDFYQLFGNDHPLILEIGFGNGEALIQQAQACPDKNYLGIEVHKPGVGRLLLQAGELGLKNIRVIRDDAMDVLKHNIRPHSLSGINLFFPDPWHKKRHNKRRIVNPAFVKLVASRLSPGGIFHAATDWQDYAEHMMQVLGDAPELLANIAGPGMFIPRPDTRPVTKFERRGERLGHGVWDLQFRRNPT